ncbi:MAG: ABC transporter permease [Williamsia sp.]|nr:ABC transporter permease [Williamsia sp.]
MPQPYNQFKAMLAITKASFRSILRSPTSVVFNIAFPLIFILVFGFIGGGSRISLHVSFNKNADTSNAIYQAIKSVSGISIVQEEDKKIQEDLEKGRLDAVINLQKNTTASPAYTINIKTSEAVNPQNTRVLESILTSIISGIDKQIYPVTPTFAAINQHVEKVKGRTYRTIDFILPGQLGFSLLSAGVFGVAFLFFNLRQTLVLKRFFATPINRSYIVFGEGLSRVLFQLITSVIILLEGYFFFKFTLVHGAITFFELLFLSFLGLMVFMGFGFIVSGLSKSESSIPPLANLITLPQFLLSGTFFSIDVFPSWLQPICRVLPLTHLNNAMRNVAFEGAHLIDCGKEIGILLLWGAVTYLVAVKVFRWE